MSDTIINTTDDLDRVLSRLDMDPTCLEMGWQWRKEPVFRVKDSKGMAYDYELAGWLLNTTFRRPDTNTGKVGTGLGGQHFVPVGSTETSVIKRCLVACKAIVEHEVMEMFRYKGWKLFNPHHSIDDLMEAAKLFRLRESEEEG